MTGIPASQLVVLFLLVVQPAAAATTQAKDADTKEIAAYRLTTAALRKVINANRIVAQQLMQHPNVQEARKIDDEIEALEKKDPLTAADEKRLDALRERQQQLEDSDDSPLGGESRTLDEMETRIKAYRPLLQALQSEGMTPREYARFWMAFVQASFAQGFKKAGMLKELPPEVNPENVKFIEEHTAEIEAMQKEFEVLTRRKN
jgi:hypothetical protein